MQEGMKVLVAYDGSSESHNALVQAVDVAKRFKGSVTALNVYYDPGESQYSATLVDTEGIAPRDEGSLRILGAAKDYLEKSKIEYEVKTVRSSNVPKTILNTAENEGYGCIALGSRGIGGARAWLLGSVSSRVIAESTCPVIVV
jgi:nucleotide-binding universal stress UspA family protein